MDWSIGHTSLVGDGDAADDSGLVLVNGHLKRLWSSVCRKLIFDEIGTKTNVIGVIFLVSPVRSCVDKSMCGQTLWVKTVNYGNRKRRRSVCRGTDIVRFLMVTLKEELFGLVLDAGILICGLKVGVPA